MNDFTNVVMAVIGIICGVLTKFLIPWIQANTTKAQQEKLRDAVGVLVYAAERLYPAGSGDEKKEYVMSSLKKQGFQLDMDRLVAFVEAEVEKLPLNTQRRVGMVNVGELTVGEVKLKSSQLEIADEPASSCNSEV